jgi:hypothetical protein
MIHKDRTSKANVEAWQRWFAYRPAYEDERVIAYRTDPAFGRDFDFIASLDDGIGIVTAEATPHGVVVGRALHIELMWGTSQKPNEDWIGRISLLSESGEVIDRAQFEPCVGWPTSEWGSNALAREELGFRVSPSIPGGHYRVALSLVGGTAEAYVIDEIEVTGTEQVLQRLELDRWVNARFGGELLFLGYAVEKHATGLDVIWHWQALRDTTASYKFFLHLYEAESGTLASQADVALHDWAYPTNFWAIGEIVSDDVRLPLGEVSPGKYELAIGVYHPGTGDRLSVSDEALATRSDALILREIVIP